MAASPRGLLTWTIVTCVHANGVPVDTRSVESLEPPQSEIDYRSLSLDFSQQPAGARPVPRLAERATVLVTGGAGYIGSTMSMLLLEKGYTVVVVDDLSRGGMINVHALQAFSPPITSFHRFDLSDTAQLAGVMRRHAIDVVIHFAANAFASESVDRPLLYFHNVTQNTLSVLEAMAEARVERLVYSSSCATYGDVRAEHIPVTEATPQNPVSPYGVSKKLSEDILRSTVAACDPTTLHRPTAPPDRSPGPGPDPELSPAPPGARLSPRALPAPAPAPTTARPLRGPSYARSTAGGRLRAAMLRYFNVVGADPETRVGPVVHKSLRPYARIADACLDAAEGLRPSLEVNGVDYLTPDGSVYRDCEGFPPNALLTPAEDARPLRSAPVLPPPPRRCARDRPCERAPGCPGGARRGERVGAAGSASRLQRWHGPRVLRARASGAGSQPA